MAEDPRAIVYSDSGVNYGMMDPFKIACQQAALTTAGNINRFGTYGLEAREITQSRGESAYEVEVSVKRADLVFRIASVEEGLGTKNEIALQMRELQAKLNLAEDVRAKLGRSFYRGVAIDNAAMILNDLSTRAATPVSFMLHVAAYPADWFTDEERNADLIEGTVDACNQARCAWGGGESPALRDIINPDHAMLSGSATGFVFPQHWKPYSEHKLDEGQRIILLESSGPHANGITLLRRDLLEKLPQGYETPLEDGQVYGEAVLAPTVIYSRLIDELFHNKVPVSYAVHISGHGWRKLMRAQKEFTYVIDKVPEPQPIFRKIQEVSGMSNEQIYGDYNMNAGFALYAPSDAVSEVLMFAAKLGYNALDAGYVEKGPRRVVINPVGVEFPGSQLQIR